MKSITDTLVVEDSEVSEVLSSDDEDRSGYSSDASDYEEEDDKVQILTYAVNCMLKDQNYKPAIEIYKDHLMNGILQSEEMKFILPKIASSVTSCVGSQESAGSPKAPRGGTSGKQRASGKRPRLPSSDGGENDNDPEQNGRGNTQSQLPRPSSGRGLYYACPFYKSNPAKYQNEKGCPGPGWKDIHRLKT
jgi:hypothetical protein